MKFVKNALRIFEIKNLLPPPELPDEKLNPPGAPPPPPKKAWNI